MRAVVQDRYGPPDVLRCQKVDLPEIARDEVLVQVRAAGVDRGVWHLVTGLPYLVRAFGYGLRRPRNRTPGSDVAGTVAAVGEEVTRFRPGDAVFGIAKGSFAEYARAREDRLVQKPIGLGYEQAAAVPVSGLAALQAVHDHGRLRAGQEVLVVGASGGVGSFAVQVAKAYGARVTGVCSTTKVDLVRALGADAVVDYTREDVTDGRRRFDLVVDTGGNRRLSALRRSLTENGVLVIVGGEGGGRWLGGTDRQLRAGVLSRLWSQRMSAFISEENEQDLLVLAEMITAGQLEPAVDRTFPLEEAPDAIRYLSSGRVRGKVVLTA